MKLCIVSGVTDDYGAMREVAERNRQQYCERHGYSQLWLRMNRRPGICPCWGKPLAILDALPDFDYVLWSDADVIFTDRAKPLTDFIDLSGGKEIVLGQRSDPPFNLCAGFMLVKRCPRAFRFLARWISMRDKISHPWSDNFGVIQLYESAFGRSVIQTVPQRSINPFWENGNLDRYQPGDFSAHFVARGYYQRVALMEQLANRIDCN